MITGLHHVAVALRDFDGGMAGYRRLFGREPEIREAEGAKRAWFGFPNMAFEVIAPVGEGAAADRVNAQLEAHGEGQWLACFSVDDMPTALKLIERRGLQPLPTRPSAALIDVAGITMALTDEAPWPLAPAIAGERAAVTALDHVVVGTANPDRAIANYGAKFGMDLRLDRVNAQWGARQMFFRCGSAVFEVGASLNAPATDAPDRFGGLAWRVDDPDAVHARLSAEGFDVSELRTGRKPGTKVFTVRDAPGGVPTIMIQQNAEPA